MPWQDSSNVPAFVGVGAGAIGLWCYWMYGKKLKFSSLLRSIPHLHLDENLLAILESSEGHSLPYACIRGKVHADDDVIKGLHNSNASGVIHNIAIKEHKSEWNSRSRSWEDVVRTVSNSSSSKPFSLSSDNDNVRVHVSQPLSASGLELETIYDNYVASNTDITRGLLEFATGEKIKGLQTIEKMLVLATELTGIGKISYRDGKLTLQPPNDKSSYILSTSSLKEIIADEDRTAYAWKIAMMVFGVSSMLCFMYWIYKCVDKYLEGKRYKRLLEDLRRQQAVEGNGADGDDALMCIICLENPKDVVILNCGHVCACKRCAEQLQTCPICRQNIERLVPMYHT